MSPTAPASTDGPRLHIEGAVATITLCRQAQRHALRIDDLHTLMAHFAAINANTAVRVVVIKAQQADHSRAAPGTKAPVFCAGFTVQDFEDKRHDPRLFEHMADALETLRPITVCAVSGSVYGGATDMVLACDLRVAVQGAVWRMPALGIGLHYYPSGLRRYVQRLGPALTQRAFFSGQALPIEDLQSSGAFHSIVPQAEFEAALQALVANVSALAPLAAQSTKQSLHDVATQAYAQAEPLLRSRAQHCHESADFAEGRNAMAQGRAPQFIGR